MMSRDDHRMDNRHIPCLFLLACGVILTLTSCSISDSTPVPEHDTGSISFSVHYPSISAGQSDVRYKAATINCQEYGISVVGAQVFDEYDDLIAVGGPWPCIDGEGTVEDVQEGTNRSVLISLKNDAGRTILTGTKSGITVIGGETTDVGVINLVSAEENSPPAAFDDSAVVNPGGTVTRLSSGESSVLANDSDPDGDNLIVAATPFSGPSHGTLTLNPDGTFSYTHDGSSTMSDSFVYQVRDGFGNTATATVTITIQAAPNTAPILTDGGVSPSSGTAAATFTFSVHYQDQDGDPPATQSIFVDNTPHSMTLTAGQSPADGIYTYATTLAAGSHTYYFSFSDGNGGTARLPAVGSLTGPSVDTTGLPDLVITTGTPTATPATVSPGGQVTLSAWTVRNQGGTASGGFSNRFYLSTDAVITSSDTYLDGNSNLSLAPGEQFAWGGPTLTIPPSMPPGTYSVGILVDWASEVAESNENNNYVSVQIVIQSPEIVHVSPTGSDSNSGLDWDHAVQTIQQGINRAVTGGQVWIRYGSYPLVSAIDVNKSIAVYGGFNGTETLLSQRTNWAGNETVVSGQSTVRCFSLSGGAADVTFDGLYIRYGRSSSNAGGGIYNYNVATSLTVANCSFTYNYALQGGAISNFNDSSHVLVTDCYFGDNDAATTQSGGAVFSRAASTEVRRCEFSDNTAGTGGAISSWVLSTNQTTIQDCYFSSNLATSTSSGAGHGGAFVCWNGTSTSAPSSTCTITGSVFEYNEASYGAAVSCINPAAIIRNCAFLDNDCLIALPDNSGGGIGIWHSDDAFVINCTINGSNAYYGAGIYANDSIVTVMNSIVWGNSSTYSNDIYGHNSFLTVDYCDLQHATGGTNCIYTDPSFVIGSFPHISSTSPCRNTGNNSAPYLPSTDFEGDGRIYGGTVDIGADEYWP